MLVEPLKMLGEVNHMLVEVSGMLVEVCAMLTPSFLAFSYRQEYFLPFLFSIELTPRFLPGYSEGPGGRIQEID